jgi:hypothetical protein
MAHLLRETRPWRSRPGLLRCAVGVGPGECLLITIWQAEAMQEEQALLQFLETRFPQAWAMRFNPGDYEIGHWNSLRLRQLVARSRQQTPAGELLPGGHGK